MTRAELAAWDRVRVVVVDSRDAFRAWEVQPAGSGDPLAATVDKIARTGEVPLLLPPNRHGFRVLCPGCGSILAGPLGDTPMSGWDNPSWTLTGTGDEPTLTPSLGCGAWRRGVCPDGHWWLRDGYLVRA